MKQTRVKKLVIGLSGQDVELTMEQAKELQVALNELFEEKVKMVERVIEKDRIVPSPYPVPYPQPIPIWPRPWRSPFWYGSERFTCTAGTQFQLGAEGTVRARLTS